MDYNLSVNSTRSSAYCLNSESWGSAVTSVAAVLIITGNLLVVLVILKYPSHRFRPMHWFIMQMAVADLSVGLAVLWIGTISTTVLKTVSLMSGIFTYGALAAATSTSTLGILFIALDRYFYILKHTKYSSIVTKKKVIIVISIACSLPFIVFIMAPALGWNCIETCFCQRYNEDPTQQYCFGEHCSQMMTPFRNETILIGGISLLLVLIISITIYAHIFSKVRCRDHYIPRNRRASEMRMMKTMLIVLGGFVLTTGPLAICCIVSFFYNKRNLHFVMRTLVVIGTTNSILNPMFYFLRIPEINKNLKMLFRDVLSACCSPCFPNYARYLRSRRKNSSTEAQTPYSMKPLPQRNVDTEKPE